ncbi:hypothetical protein DFH09DRAFT_1458058 [Mycena vulgaris]|nr:hypothetical protein DFH09DRAFT_1458058 [Mycena vulgaris]
MVARVFSEMVEGMERKEPWTCVDGQFARGRSRACVGGALSVSESLRTPLASEGPPVAADPAAPCGTGGGYGAQQIEVNYHRTHPGAHGRPLSTTSASGAQLGLSARNEIRGFSRRRGGNEELMGICMAVDNLLRSEARGGWTEGALYSSSRPSDTQLRWKQACTKARDDYGDENPDPRSSGLKPSALGLQERRMSCGRQGATALFLLSEMTAAKRRQVKPLTWNGLGPQKALFLQSTLREFEGRCSPKNQSESLRPPGYSWPPAFSVCKSFLVVLSPPFRFKSHGTLSHSTCQSLKRVSPSDIRASTLISLPTSKNDVYTTGITTKNICLALASRPWPDWMG